MLSSNFLNVFLVVDLVLLSSSASGMNMEWITFTKPTIPSGAVLVGLDLNGCPLYVCRATVDGQLTPGKLRADAWICDVSYGGTEHPETTFEGLISTNGAYGWVQSSNGQIVQNAVVAAYRSSAPLYVARALVDQKDGVISSGKVQIEHSCDCAMLPFNGKRLL